MTIDYQSIAEKCESTTIKKIIEPKSRESWDDYKNATFVITNSSKRKCDE
jgi:hypothetical protein